jgi:predicted PurR-regulated permease PerM
VQPVIAFVFAVAILYVAKPVIVPLALAVLLTFAMAPLVTMVQGLGLTRIPAVFITAILTFVLLAAVACIVGIQVQHLAGELPAHRQEIEAKITSLRGSRDGTFAKLLEMFRQIGRGETEEMAAENSQAAKEVVVVSRTQENSNFQTLVDAVGPVLEPLAEAGLVVILVLFMLIKREDLRNRLIGLLGHGHLTGTTRVLVDSAKRLSRFLLTLLLINVAFGILFGTSLFLVGVPYAFLWGFVIVLLRFVPYIGSIIGVAFPLILSFATAPDWTQPIIVLAVFLVLELITANVIEPLLFGHGTGLSPIALLVAAAFWTWVWGPIGLVLSTPITVCVVVLGRHVPRLRFLALLLGDEPALEPYASYYQRLLARDQQEAELLAADYARVNGGEKLFDDVLMPALTLTSRDRKHKTIQTEDDSFILQTTRSIVETLMKPFDSEDNGQCGPSKSAESGSFVLGCPAHQESEELALGMLNVLLSKDGRDVEAVTTKMLPIEMVKMAERKRPALVFIAIIPPGGLVQARYICRQLRKRFAELPIVVGYWGNERHFDRVLERLRSAGASYVTTSLHQSRNQILALAATRPGHLEEPSPTLGSARIRA